MLISVTEVVQLYVIAQLHNLITLISINVKIFGTTEPIRSFDLSSPTFNIVPNRIYVL